MYERPQSNEDGREEYRNDPTESDRGESERTVLTNERRRFVMHDLTTHFHPVPAYDLADRLSAWESTAEEPVSFEEARRQLVEEHLPRLERAGLVESTDGPDRYAPTGKALDLELTVRGLEATAENGDG
jgi:hypothetical protein